ncbi:MAG: cytochrome c [Acidobacteria bacterium]|nr:cytochrome c [Acidobacteriota bacterium]
MRWSVRLVLVVVVLALGALLTVGRPLLFGPNARPVTGRTFEATEARLARGEYLVENVAHCFHCHSEHDFTKIEGPIVEGMKGAGWFMEEGPGLGKIVAPNITSDPATGLGAWTDDEVARAIREGIGRDGTALFPIMPYLSYRDMSDEDLASVIVYLRTIPPVKRQLARTSLEFPISRIVNTIPVPLEASVPEPAAGARGAYLAKLAECQTCHTPAVQGEPLPGMAFGGGFEFRPVGRTQAVVSANITPGASGIAHYDEALFDQVMRTGRLPGRQLSGIMPYSHFTGLSADDMKAIWTHIKAQAPVQHRVSNTDEPTDCAVCGITHGRGNLNVKTN